MAKLADSFVRRQFSRTDLLKKLADGLSVQECIPSSRVALPDCAPAMA
jgi:hypothetical protein